MKRACFLFLLLSMLAPISYAQDNKTYPMSDISLGPEFALPIGEFRKNNSVSGLPDVGYNYGVGASVKYLLRLNKRYGLSVQAGAIRYHAESSPSTSAEGLSSFTAIPVKLGANIRFRSFFTEPQIGASYFTGNNALYVSGATTYGLNIGAYLTDQLVLSGNYERWNKGGAAASHVGVRLAYSFSLRNLSPTDSIRKERVYSMRYDYDKTSEAWRTHKTLKTLGWVSAGVGVPLTLLGLLTSAIAIETDSINPSTYQWMIGSGLTLSAASVPLFIFSHKYKKKARI